MIQAGDPTITSVRVGSGAGAYEVLVGEGLLDQVGRLLSEQAPAHRYVVIADDQVTHLYGGSVKDHCASLGARVDVLTFPHGEASKTREVWSELTDSMLRLGVGRDAVVVALGGGVTGDMAGFVAATYLRGIPVVQVPTSLVAMVDASVGGKTGVDTPAGKNLVGAFHPPRFVLIDPCATRTLPREERAQGLAEAVKHGAILDRAYFDELDRAASDLLDGDVAATRSAVLRSVQIKAGIVSDDEREAGVRQVLNFGHTLGHALEAASSYEVGHGAAVAAGMVLEAELGERMGVTREGTAAVLAATLQRFGLNGVSFGIHDVERVLDYLGIDKKARRGRPRVVLLERVGVVAEEEGWSREAPYALVRAVVEDAAAGRGRQR